MIRTLIVDDEPAARERLRQLLAAAADVEIAGEAGDGLEAIEKISALAPDLVLLDIQMPGCTGLDVAASLAEPRPRIIFCTAYDQHALEAFELNAVDYLLKPINRTRLAAALDRVRGADRAHADLTGSAKASPVEKVRATKSPRSTQTRFLGKHANRYHVIEDTAVLYFGVEDGMTKLVTATSHYWMDPSLNDLESRLDESSFFRISRNAIVNLHAVKQVVPHQGGAGQVVLNTGAALEVSRRRFADLLHQLGR